MDNNINIKDLHNGYVEVTPKEGYRLFSLNIQRFVSEAVVKEEEVKYFKAIANE